MKRHVQQPGIRKWAAEDLLELQSEPLKALDEFFEEYEPCVIKGCNIFDNEDDTYNISAGLVALKGTDVAGNVTFKIVPFSGVENCPLPAYFFLSYSVVEREYADGKVKPIAYDYRAAVTAIKPEDVYYLELSLDNVPRFVDVIQNSEHRFMTDTEREKLKNIDEGANKYVHPVTSGNKHIPVGGSSGQILKWGSDGTAVWDYNDSLCPYGVGDIFITKSSANPATTWPGTTWKKLEGRFLYGTSGSEASGGTGGATEVVLSTANLPVHNHSVSIGLSPAGSHNHLVDSHRHQVESHSHTQPNHKHIGGHARAIGWTYSSGRFGTYNIYENISTSPEDGNHYPVAYPYTSDAGGDSTGISAPYTNYSNPSTSMSGDHSHSVNGSIGNTGSGNAFSILPSYIKVYMWERQS